MSMLIPAGDKASSKSPTIFAARSSFLSTFTTDLINYWTSFATIWKRQVGFREVVASTPEPLQSVGSKIPQQIA
jgi:hypothetical protein